MTNALSAIQIETKNIGEDGSIKGLGAIFNTQDRGGDTILPGAFKKSLQAHSQKGLPVQMLRGHDPDRIIGEWTSVQETKDGLLCEGQIYKELPDGKEAHFLARKGQLSGLSIGYQTEKSTRDEEWNRTLQEVDLFEVSLVTFPMHPDARVTDVKNLTGDIRDVEKALREAGFSKTAAKLVARHGHPEAFKRLETQREADSDTEAAAARALLSQLSSLKESLNV